MNEMYNFYSIGYDGQNQSFDSLIDAQTNNGLIVVIEHITQKSENNSDYSYEFLQNEKMVEYIKINRCKLKITCIPDSSFNKTAIKATVIDAIGKSNDLYSEHYAWFKIDGIIEAIKKVIKIDEVESFDFHKKMLQPTIRLREEMEQAKKRSYNGKNNNIK